MAPFSPVALISSGYPAQNSESSQLKPITIAGIVVASVVAASLLVWFAIRYFRKRAAANRQDKRSSAFMTVKGVIRDGEDEKASEAQGYVHQSFLCARDRRLTGFS